MGDTFFVVSLSSSASFLLLLLLYLLFLLRLIPSFLGPRIQIVASNRIPIRSEKRQRKEK
jgi:hypothetical protein